MRKVAALWCIIGLFGWVTAASAQTPMAPTAAPVTKYDGTYAFVTQTMVNETYLAGDTRPGRCRNRRASSPLIIVNGQAHFTTAAGIRVEGTVEPQGELAMRYPPTPNARCSGCTAGIERSLSGTIGSDGAVRARDIGYWCSHDMTWQKHAK
jgi:hypothetical protein